MRLIGVIATIGGGFYKIWENSIQDCQQLKEQVLMYLVSQKTRAEIAKSNERISLLEKDNKDNDISGISKNEKQVAILSKEVEVLKLQIQELKLKSQNPLAN